MNQATDPAALPTVTVRGEAVLRAAPDEGSLSVTISNLDSTPGGALADVAARSEKLTAILDELEIPAADRQTAGVSVGEEFEHTKAGRRSLGHRASALTEIRTVDHDLIGLLIDRATGLSARVEGPRWRITQAHPVRLQAAREAAADGYRKAQAYAEGVNATVGPLLTLVEADVQTARGFRTAAAASAGSDVKRMPIEAGEQEVAAAVYLTFALNAEHA